VSVSKCFRQIYSYTCKNSYSYNYASWFDITYIWQRISHSIPNDAYVSATDSSPISHEEKQTAFREVGFNLAQGELSEQQFGELIDLLYEYRQVFVTDIKDLPGVKGVEYDITLQPHWKQNPLKLSI